MALPPTVPVPAAGPDPSPSQPRSATNAGAGAERGDRPVPPSFGLTLDAGLRRAEGGTVLIGGSPLRIMKLSAAGAAVVDRWAAGEAVGARTAAQRLARRLLDAGMVHPRPRPAAGTLPASGPSAPAAPALADVTAVIPVHNDLAGLHATLAALGPVGSVIVVDDGSVPPLPGDALPAGVRLLRRPIAGGPGTARTVGLAAVTTPFVLFVDADVALPGGWADVLLAHLRDPAVVAVAPRITSRPGPSVRERFEADRSPLDLGPAPARVAARSAVAYVPAAALLARAEAVRAIGGFAGALRYGEDVDLVWRLTEQGATVRYEPSVVAHHRPRASWRAWLAQRYRYGTAAAPLALRHPGQVPPLQVSAWSAAAWAAAALGHPAAGLAVAGGSTALLPRKLTVLADPKPEALRLAGLGHLHAGRWIAQALTRSWWPLALAVALVWRRARPALLAAAVLPALSDWRSRRSSLGLGPLRYVALRLADDAAYGAGVWAGCLVARSAAPLRPDLSSWPGRRGAVQAGTTAGDGSTGGAGTTGATRPAAAG